jgi:hypothetical protein
MATRKTPWDRPNPRKRAGKPAKHLTPAMKRKAKTRARKAGRPYPNLVDNMAVASGRAVAGRKRKAAKKTAKKTAKKSRARKTAASGRKRAA